MCAVSDVPKVITMLTAARLLNWSVDIVRYNPLAQDAFVTSKIPSQLKSGFWQLLIHSCTNLTAVNTSLYHFDSRWYVAAPLWQLLIHCCTILTAVDTSLHHFDSCWYIAAPFHCFKKTWNRCSRMLPSTRSLFIPRLNLTRCVRWFLWEVNVLQCTRFYLVTSYFICRAWGTLFNSRHIKPYDSSAAVRQPGFTIWNQPRKTLTHKKKQAVVVSAMNEQNHRRSR